MLLVEVEVLVEVSLLFAELLGGVAPSSPQPGATATPSAARNAAHQRSDAWNVCDMMGAFVR